MHTKGPWEYRHVPAGEEGIYAKLKIKEGKEAVCRIFEVPQKPVLQTAGIHDGIIEIEVAYSAWFQFEVGDINKDQWKANATLIAAAPDLLEACREALRSIEADPHRYAPISLYNKLLMAITKATE